MTVKEDGSVHWELTEINPVYEVSPCVFQAYEATHISARGKDMEDFKRRRMAEWREKAKRRLKGDGIESAETAEAD